jgi:hypothetical protein
VRLVGDPYALTLYERLLRGGEATLLEQLQAPDPETDHIDFKNVATPPTSLAGKNPRLVDEDKKTLGEALSGFANSLGGVIVWGIDCRGHKELERKLHPGLDDSTTLKSVLNSLVGGATVPGLMGVRLDEIALPATGKSALLMYVPRREYGPVRATTKGTDRYYFRVGDQFHSVPHDVLASMFGRAPPPQMSWRVIAGATSPALEGAGLRIEIAIILYNSGDGMAFHPYVNLTMFSPSEDGNFEFLVEQIDSERFTMHGVLRHFITFVGRRDHPIPGGGFATVAMLKMKMNVSARPTTSG